MSRTRIAGITLFFAASLFIALFRPFPLLPRGGHSMLALALASLSLWVFRGGATPYLAGSSILLAGGLLSGIPLATVAGGYISPAIWVLIPALFFGFALSRTGLGTRIAYLVLRTFEPRWGTITLSWCLIGLLLSAMTPSITVRLSIVMPVAMGMVEACGIPARSRGSALICLTAWASAILPGTGWQTGSLWGIIMTGFYPAALKSLVTPGSWFRCMAVPWGLITTFFLLLCYTVFRPREPLRLDREHFRERYEALGPISRDEMACGIILVSALFCFSAEKWIGLAACETALLALAALIFTGIVKSSDVSSGVNWDIVNFIATAIALPVLFAVTGVSNWARSVVEPWLFPVAGSPLTLLIVITLSFWIVRFIDIPWGYTTIALFSPVFVPLHEHFGLHPLLVSVAVIAAGNSFFLSYQQPFMVIGDSVTKGKGWSGGQAALAGLLYAVSVVAALAMSSCYWRAMGLMPA